MSNIKRFSSRKEVTKFLKEKGIDTSNWSEEKWLKINKGQAEIHMMALAESIWDAVNESIPKQLQAGEWHVPFEDNITLDNLIKLEMVKNNNLPLPYDIIDYTQTKVKISTAMTAHTSYTTVGNEPVKSYEKWIELHDKLIAYDPPHSSPMEHCARAMSDEEYNSFYKGYVPMNGSRDEEKSILGWCRNYKGFIQYRHLIENKL